MARTSTQDETLYCERCGISFLWTGEEQRESQAVENNAEGEETGQKPTRCPGCRHLLPSPGYERGEVKWYNPRKRFGFIVRATQPDIFVHRSGIKGGVKLRTGDLVEFSVAETDEKLAARDVTVLVKGGKGDKVTR